VKFIPAATRTAKKAAPAKKTGGAKKTVAAKSGVAKKASTARKATVVRTAAAAKRATAIRTATRIRKARSSGGTKIGGPDLSDLSASHVKLAQDPAWQPGRRAGFLVDVLGNKGAADLLGVSASQPSRWKRAEEVPGPQAAPVLIDLDHVVARLLLVWDASIVRDRLTSANAFLDGARPIDVLVTRGSTEVVEAIEAEAAGAYP
jgi:hypothetical protein